MTKATERLVKEARQGDKEAFTAIILEHEKSLYRTANTILKNDEDARDAIQDTILESYNSIRTLKEPKFFKTWLIRILINKCYLICYEQKKHRYLQIDQLEVEAPQNDRDIEFDVRKTIKELSQNDQLILSLFYFEDISIKEIATILSISEGAVRTRLSRSREHFKSIYIKKEAPCHET